jgi:hypothetical protein
VKLIDRLPYYDETSYLTVGETPVEVRRYQIVVRVSLTGHLFPAILDSGHSHNFTISQRQLERFAGIDSLPVIGHTEVNRQLLPQVKADVWLHGNSNVAPLLMLLPASGLDTFRVSSFGDAT